MSISLERVREIAREAHDGQTRKDDSPYYLHPWAVMEILRKQGHSESTQAIGGVHDVLEDTDWTEDDLMREGFTEADMVVLDYLTKKDDPAFYSRLYISLTPEELMEYGRLRHSGYASKRHALSLIRAAHAPDPRARAVKLADGLHNLDGTLSLIDMNIPTTDQVRQLGKYGVSVAYLSSFPLQIT